MSPEARTWLLNLTLPGGGLILLDRPLSGLVVGLAFVLAANAAVAMALLFPDDYSATWRGLAIGAAGGIYFGAQVRLARAWRSRARVQTAAIRSQALREAVAALDADEPQRALATLEPLSRQFPNDLVVAYRLAQARSALGDAESALAAWERVRALDRHRLYREFIRRAEERLRDGAGASSD